MKPVVEHEGVAIPFRRSYVDTDQIISSEYLKSIKRTGFEDALFATWREDPNFILNMPEYRRASILVAGPDFGTGSSREHAVWALNDYGFRVIISSRFADIFRSNAGKQGLLTAECDQADVELLWSFLDYAPGEKIKVDLQNKTLTASRLIIPFRIDAYTRWRLMEGLDDIDLTLRDVDAINNFESGRANWLPRSEAP